MKLIIFIRPIFIHLYYQAKAAPQITRRMNNTKMNAYLPFPLHPPQQALTLLQFPIFTPPFTLVYAVKNKVLRQISIFIFFNFRNKYIKGDIY